MGGRLIHEVDLYTSKYGNHRLRVATVHNSGGFRSSAPGVSFASSVISLGSCFVVITMDAILEKNKTTALIRTQSPAQL